jgi:hypothetical protein
MSSRTYVATPVAGLIGVEVVERSLPVHGQWTVISTVRIKAIIDVAEKAMRAVEPWASSKKHSTGKPVGAVVAIRRAIIGSVVEVPIGADRFHSDANGNLGWPQGGAAKQRNRES